MKQILVMMVLVVGCGKGDGDSKTAEEAAQDGDIPALKRMAENGDAEAQYHLAHGYFDGGITRKLRSGIAKLPNKGLTSSMLLGGPSTIPHIGWRSFTKMAAKG